MHCYILEVVKILERNTGGNSLRAHIYRVQQPADPAEASSMEQPLLD